MIDLSDEKIYTHVNESKNIEIRNKINNSIKNDNLENEILETENDNKNRNNIYLIIIILIVFAIIYYFLK
jgi:hypothetical protein